MEPIRPLPDDPTRGLTWPEAMARLRGPPLLPPIIRVEGNVRPPLRPAEIRVSFEEAVEAEVAKRLRERRSAGGKARGEQRADEADITWRDCAKAEVMRIDAEHPEWTNLQLRAAVKRACPVSVSDEWLDRCIAKWRGGSEARRRLRAVRRADAAKDAAKRRARR